MSPIQYLQTAVSLGLLVCSGLWLYLMFVRSRKQKDVDLQIWLVIGIGLLFSIATQYLGVVQGITAWSKVQLNILVSAALAVFSAYMIYRKLTGVPPQPPQSKQKRANRVEGPQKRKKNKYK